jgi:C4-dicarboxylate-specific signal transduction histidine kinase
MEDWRRRSPAADRPTTTAEGLVAPSPDLSDVVFTSLTDCIAVLASNGTIIAVNDAWSRLAGDASSPELVVHGTIGARFVEVCDRFATEPDVVGVQAVLDGTLPRHRSEYASITPDRPRWWSLDVLPLRGVAGGALVMHREVTEERRNYANLAELRAQAWHAHRVAQTGVIAGSLAHELNQPLAAILSNAQAGLRLMSRPDVDLEEIRAILDDIVYDDKRAASVIDGLRAMLRRKATRREPTDLGEVVRGMLVLVRNELLSHDIQVEFQADAASIVLADHGQMQQVVLNLLMNAMDALADQPVERRRIAIAVAAVDGHARIDVRDWGCGIAADELDHVLDAFWSTKEHGMGIGLTICRSIVEAHGGQLWFENHPGLGVTFHVSVPLMTRTPATERP